MNRHMKRKMRALGLVALMMTASTQIAMALTTDEVIATFQADGFTRIEVKQGPTQIKVEAIRGTEKVETIYDAETGAVLKSEVETVGPNENVTPGVSVRDRNSDFVDVGDDEDDDDENDDDEDEDEDESDDDEGDDGDDDHGGHGGDDDHDDDHGGGNSGSGGGGGDDD
jgi:uncharacterized membrane protein YgcG